MFKTRSLRSGKPYSLFSCVPSGVVGPLEAHAEDVQDDDVFLNGTLSSPECGIVLHLNGTTTHVEEHYAKAINYTLMVTAVSFLQVRPVRRRFHNEVLLRPTLLLCFQQNKDARL